MHNSQDRILTTHVGSLPRNRELSDLLIAAEAGRAVDQQRLDALAADGVESCVNQQVKVGLDVINDGEQPRVGFQTYVGQRLEGFGGVSEREPFVDFADHPDFADVWFNRGMVMSKVFDATGGECGGQLHRFRARETRMRSVRCRARWRRGSISRAIHDGRVPGYRVHDFG